MKSLTTVSSEEFLKAKSQAVGKQLIRKELALSEFQVEDNDHLMIDGVKVRMSAKAFTQLLSRFRIPKAFAARLSEGIGKQGLVSLVQVLKMTKQNHRDQKVTFLVNPQMREISYILPEGYGSISAESFFDFAEQIINKYDLQVVNVGANDQGGAVISTQMPGSVFKVPGYNKEVFSTGFNLSLDPIIGLQGSPFLERLLCANGITSTAMMENISLTSLSDKAIREFNDDLLLLASTGFQPVGFKETITRAMNTDASLAEMQMAANHIAGAVGKFKDWDYVQRYVPIDRSMKAYDVIGANPEEFTSAQRANAKSGVKIWDVVNAVTNFASNDPLPIDSYTRGHLMTRAGNLLFKRRFDTEDLIPVDPFAKRDLLSPEQLARMRGDN